jgi:short-subunit dehydrogenase
MTGDQKYALVTGASSGIGWQLSRQLAGMGYSLVAVSNQQDELELLKKEILAEHEVTVRCICMDLAREQAAEELHARCREDRLRVEVLVNNAGMMIFGEMASAPEERMKALLQLHMLTPALLCRYFGADMQKSGTGYILNVASISAVMPFPTISLYGPSKTFLRAFTSAIRKEMIPRGVRVTCLIPGSTDTPLNAGNAEVEALSRLLGRPMKPEKVARLGLQALFGGKAEVIPGAINKLLVHLLPLVPGGIIRAAYRRQHKAI